MSERSTIARIGAYSMHAKHDTKVVSAPGRQAAWARFEKEVDPNGELEPAERERRANMLRKAHYSRLGLASAAARKKRRKQTTR